MSHNPLASELAGKAAELEGLRSRRSEFRSSLDWFSAFDRAAAEKEATLEQARFHDLEEQLAATQDGIAAATQQTSALQAKTDAGWDPRYWFSKDREQAKEQLATHNRKLADLGTRQTELNSRLDWSRNKLEEAERSIARYDQFDQANINAELVALDAEIPIRQREHDALAERKERLDQQLVGTVASLTELQSDLEHAKSRREWLRLDVDRIERDIKEATKLEKQLTAARDGRARREIHLECEDEFDDGSPGRVLGDRRRKLNDARHEISNLDRRIPAIERQVKKTEQRVATIVARGTRDIRSIVIDGNNLCYQDAKFIGIAALRPLCLHLKENYEVTLIFDASIRPLLSGTADESHWITEESLRQRFPDTTLHIVAARTQADETILAAAADPGAYVLSNDRFSDHRDKPTVREERLINHEILNGQILVHDLDIGLTFDLQS